VAIVKPSEREQQYTARTTRLTRSTVRRKRHQCQIDAPAVCLYPIPSHRPLSTPHHDPGAAMVGPCAGPVSARSRTLHDSGRLKNGKLPTRSSSTGAGSRSVRVRCPIIRVNTRRRTRTQTLRLFIRVNRVDGCPNANVQSYNGL